eukprot:GHVS01042555.1.p1 GENE.GHVS01042555.1~~GHVS01042555.1.p1  ORF type:complete len:619 (+),score=121.87 GHVS01042555.1:1025-2881(+)
MDRALAKCGRHWCSHSLWMNCINFEENQLKSITEALATDKKQAEHNKSSTCGIGGTEQTALARLRHMYWALLRTPHSKLSSSWEKFKVVLGQGRTESQTVCLDVTDLIVEEELEEFQTFVMQKLLKEKESAHVERWRGSLQRADADKTYENIAQPMHHDQVSPSAAGQSSRRVRVLFPDGGAATFKATAATSISAVRAACMITANAQLDGMEEVDLLWNRKAVKKDALVGDIGKKEEVRAGGEKEQEEKSTEGKEGSTTTQHNSRPGQTEEKTSQAEEEEEEEELSFVLFDGEALSQALQQVSGRAVEKWFLRQRERTYLSTLEGSAVQALFESQLRRTYFHPFPLSADQLTLWRNYLHYAKKNMDEDEALLLMRRSVEACCSYPEFWSCYAEEWRRRGRADVARQIYRCATRIAAAENVEIHFLEAQFVENEGNAAEGEHLLLNIANQCPQSIEAHVRLSWLNRRRRRPVDSENGLTKAMAGGQWEEEEKGRLGVELGYLVLREQKNTEKAINILAGAWAQGKSLVLLRFYMGVLRRHSKGNFSKIVSLYEEGIQQKKYSLVSRWKLWKDYLNFVQHEARLRDVCKIKDRFADFLFSNAESLEKCRKRRRPMAPQEP